ncbi:uncharacterized protein [Chlorocebus sabaeus]|uniref:uncharacterized protein n=1 Tax=Chlorocebus sabaeus TaxID=60711 RepID=UPI003BFA21E4
MLTIPGALSAHGCARAGIPRLAASGSRSGSGSRSSGAAARQTESSGEIEDRAGQVGEGRGAPERPGWKGEEVRLRSGGGRRRAQIHDGGRGGDPGRECVCVHESARGGAREGLGSLGRPATASCSPRRDADGIPTARPHRPALTLAHPGTHTPRRRTPGSALPTRSPGAVTKAPKPGQLEPSERGPAPLPYPPASGAPLLPVGTPRAARLPHPAWLGRGRAPSPNPGPGADSGFPHSRPKRRPPPLRRRPSSPFLPGLSGASLPSPTCPARSSVSPLLSACLAAAFSRAPSSPPPCATSHILRITAGAARRSRGPGFEGAVGREGTRRAWPSRPVRSPRLLGSAWR